MSFFGGVSDTAGDPLGSGTSDTLASFTVEIENSSATVYNTCPGNGPQMVPSMGAYVKVASGTGNIRLAICGPVDGTHDTHLIAQSSALLPVSNTSLAWISTTSFINASGNPVVPVLQAGSIYRLMVGGFTGDGSSFGYGVAGAHNLFANTSTTMSGGTAFVDPVAVFTNDDVSELPNIRVEVVAWGVPDEGQYLPPVGGGWDSTITVW